MGLDCVGRVRQDREKGLLAVGVLDAHERELLWRLVARELAPCRKIVDALLEQDRDAVELDLGQRVEPDRDGDLAADREALRIVSALGRWGTTDLAAQRNVVPHLALPEALDDDALALLRVILTGARDEHDVDRRRKVCRQCARAVDHGLERVDDVAKVGEDAWRERRGDWHRNGIRVRPRAELLPPLVPALVVLVVFLVAVERGNVDAGRECVAEHLERGLSPATLIPVPWASLWALVSSSPPTLLAHIDRLSRPRGALAPQRVAQGSEAEPRGSRRRGPGRRWR